MKKFDLSIYSDFDTQFLNKILSIKYSISSLSHDFTPNIIRPVCEDSVHSDVVLFWHSLESFKKTYGLFFIDVDESIAKQKIDSAVNFYLEQIKIASSLFKHLLVCSIDKTREGRGQASRNYTLFGDSYISAKINLSLTELSADLNSLYILDTQLFRDDKKSLNDKSWFLTKSPFTRDYLINASREIKKLLDLISKGREIKLILLDLDNTIWGGEIGDDGLEGIRLGGHDHIGEAYVDFQNRLLLLNQNGIQIAIVSKNNEVTARNVFQTHPDMILKEQNIASWKINWKSKYINIMEIAQEMNIGLDSMIFLDDNPAERLSVKENIPEVNVPNLPKDPCSYSKFLSELDCFDILKITTEDLYRTRTYISNIKRKKVMTNFQEGKKWLESLNTIINIKAISELTINRYVQLLNKTNQYNLKTRRINFSDFERWTNQENNNAYTIDLEDKFGKMGIIGLLGFKVDNNEIFIEDFILSCRASGRKIEDCILTFIANKAYELGCKKVYFEAIKTQKNKPMIDFLDCQKYLIKNKRNLYIFDSSKFKIKYPEFIKVNLNEISNL